MTQQWHPVIRISVCSLFAFTLILSAMACRPSPAAQPTTASTAPAANAPAEEATPANGTVLQPGAGTLGGELAIAPFPVAVMKETQLQLRLLDQDGTPITGAQVIFDLTMPSMMMPVNQVTATEGPEGVYSASAYFSMGGGWQVNCLVTRGDQQDKVVFSFDIK